MWSSLPFSIRGDCIWAVLDVVMGSSRFCCLGEGKDSLGRRWDAGKGEKRMLRFAEHSERKERALLRLTAPGFGVDHAHSPDLRVRSAARPSGGVCFSVSARQRATLCLRSVA